MQDKTAIYGYSMNLPDWQLIMDLTSLK